MAEGRKQKIIITSRAQEQLEPDVDIQEQFYPLIYPETVLDTRSETITNSAQLLCSDGDSDFCVLVNCDF